MNYFDSEYLSNSDLKQLRKYMDPKFEDPADLKEIFSFGTLFHALVLEPHKADYTHKDLELAKRMAKTFFDDPLCRQVIMVGDIKREYEYYRLNAFGVKARCKCDLMSKAISLVGELKGLACDSEKSFDEAMDRFDYDQAVAWYLDVAQKQNYFMAAVSKKSDKLFKRLVNRDHVYYKRGIVKVNKAVKQFKEVFA
jgi:hypothetical protein